MRFSIPTLPLIILAACHTTGDYPYQPVPFTNVHCQDQFWQPRIETNRRVTIPYAFSKCEETHRIANFAIAGGLEKGVFKGIYYNDSDVFKVMEGAAYALHNHPDPELERRLDEVIAKVAAAQEDDGYLYTCRTINPEKTPTGAGPKRWCNLKWSHELYNIGHLYEAAAAHWLATGKKSLLAVALKSADLVDRKFGPGENQLHDVPGHQEIEIGLVKLYRITGQEKYLRLAKYFLDQRGKANQRELYTFGKSCEYTQDHKPVTKQEKPVGHAVRAGYMYSAMTDIAALTGDQDYRQAVDRLWHNVISSYLYITGGIGASHSGEAFGKAYELPNKTAYCETCAAIANMLWNQRLFLLHGHGRFIDVLERTLYNNFLSGISLKGNRFFYPNPLASDGSHQRSPWFSCSCCPVNVARFLPSLPGYVYARGQDEIFVNLYIGGEGVIDLEGQKIKLIQKTAYPWQGKIKIQVEPDQPTSFTLKLRIPGWARGIPTPGGLYTFMRENQEQPVVMVNGNKVPSKLAHGYLPLSKCWQSGDRIELQLPMPVRQVKADERVQANQGRFCLQRGPLVYAVEGIDNQGHITNLVPDCEFGMTPINGPDLLRGGLMLKGQANALVNNETGQLERHKKDLFAIPYYAWAHRGPAQMQVWLPLNDSTATPLPPPSIASRSRVTASYIHDQLNAVNDQVVPADSNDHSISRLTFWAHKGTREWVRYDFAKPHTVSATEIYWFDDRARNGGCRLPAAWKLLYRDAKSKKWLPVKGCAKYPIKLNAWSKATFNPVKTDALRLDLNLEPGYSGGLLEWRICPSK